LSFLFIQSLSSMSLLMEFMPEYYSSNVTQLPTPKPATTLSLSAAKKPKQGKPSSPPRKVFYLLKDEQVGANMGEALKTATIGNMRAISGGRDELALAKQNRIRNDLLLLLRQQPQKFQIFKLPDTFNCTNKRMGLHRDKSDCTKYYLCNGRNYYVRQKTLQKTILRKFYSEVHYDNLMGAGASGSQEEGEIDPTKAYTCPENTAFNMNGCFCDPSEFKNRCQYLSDTFCDYSSMSQSKFDP
jgi:hypothetical protein